MNLQQRFELFEQKMNELIQRGIDPSTDEQLQKEFIELIELGSAEVTDSENLEVEITDEQVDLKLKDKNEQVTIKLN